MLPILVTTPPMIERVHFRRHGHHATGRGRETLLQLRRALGRERYGRRDFGAQHVPMLHQSFAVHLEEIRKQRQPTTRRQQQHELAGRRRRLQAIQNLLHDGTLVSGRDDGIRQRALQIGMPLYEIDESRELLLQRVRDRIP